MNTQNLPPEPKNIQLSNGAVAVILPSGDLSIIQKGNNSVYLEAEDLRNLVQEHCALLGPLKPNPLQFSERAAGEPKKRYGLVEMGVDLELVGRRHTAAFLRKCRVIVMQDPIYEYSPFQDDVIPEIVLHFGKKEGHGEINPDMEYESYLDGKTFKLRNIVSITP